MKRKAQRSKLKPWQQEDAARVHALLEAEKLKPDWVNLERFVEIKRLSFSSSYLSQLAAGYRPINLKHAVGLARGFGVDVDKISPTLAKELTGVPASPVAVAEPQSPGYRSNRRVSEYDRSVFRALDTLDPDVRMSIKSMILTLAAAKSASYAQWSGSIDKFNQHRTKKKTAAREE